MPLYEFLDPADLPGDPPRSPGEEITHPVDTEDDPGGNRDPEGNEKEWRKTEADPRGRRKPPEGKDGDDEPENFHNGDATQQHHETRKHHEEEEKGVVGTVIKDSTKIRETGKGESLAGRDPDGIRFFRAGRAAHVPPSRDMNIEPCPPARIACLPDGETRD